jgi:hypothetical protein
VHKVAAPRASSEHDKLRDIKVQFSSRISYGADQQLKALAKQGHTQTELLAEALNLLFRKHDVDEVASGSVILERSGRCLVRCHLERIGASVASRRTTRMKLALFGEGRSADGPPCLRRAHTGYGEQFRSPLLVAMLR